MSNPSLRGCINAKCKECIYDNMARGNWRQQVEACTSFDCPLWIARPVSKPRTVPETEPEDVPE